MDIGPSSSFRIKGRVPSCSRLELQGERRPRIVSKGSVVTPGAKASVSGRNDPRRF